MTPEGTIRISPHPHFNLSHGDVILGLNTEHTTGMVASHVMNNLEHMVASNTDMGGIVWKNGSQTQYFQHTRLGEGHASNFSEAMMTTFLAQNPNWGFYPPNSLYSSQMPYTSSYSIS